MLLLSLFSYATTAFFGTNFISIPAKPSYLENWSCPTIPLPLQRLLIGLRLGAFEVEGVYNSLLSSLLSLFTARFSIPGTNWQNAKYEKPPEGSSGQRRATKNRRKDASALFNR